MGGHEPGSLAFLLCERAAHVTLQMLDTSVA